MRKRSSWVIDDKISHRARGGCHRLAEEIWHRSTFFVDSQGLFGQRSNVTLNPQVQWAWKIFCAWYGLSTMVFASAESKDFGTVLLSSESWNMSMEDWQKQFRIDLTPEQKRLWEARQAHAKSQGLDVAEEVISPFRWLSDRHDGLQAPPGRMMLWGQKIGEVIVRAKEDRVGFINISLYNRGDDETITVSALQTKFAEWKKLLEEKTAKPGEERKSTGAVSTLSYQWRLGETALLLEASIGEDQGQARAEFLRLRAASTQHASTKITNRSSLRGNVKRMEDGDVFIHNMPMVDQGQKGYCAVATIARVASYYGLDVDQHEIAQLANTSELGTSTDEMEASFKTIISKLHIRTTQHFEISPRQFEADVRAYNQLAKKKGAEVFKAPDGYQLNPTAVWESMDPEIFATVKSSQSGCKRFMTKVSEYIDQGIPLCWCLRLGIFPEKDLPQQGGGHMRLIIGYNAKTQEIIYSDSWGKGHEFKKMPLAHAYASSSLLYTMSPTR